MDTDAFAEGAPSRPRPTMPSAALLADAEHKKRAAAPPKRRGMILISEKEKFFDPRKPFQSARPETHEEWQARMGGEVLAVVRKRAVSDFRFLDQALSALTPTADERCGVLATDGTILCYQPSALLRLYQKNPKYLNRLYLHTVFHCIFRHLWLRGKRDKRLWDLACDIAVENVIDGLGRKSVQRPLTWVRQHAYEEIIGQESGRGGPHLPLAEGGDARRSPPAGKNSTPTTTASGPKMPPNSPSRCPPLCPGRPGKNRRADADRAGTRDKEAGEGADAMREQIKSRKPQPPQLRRLPALVLRHREEVHLDPDEFDLNFYTYGLSVYGNLPLIEPLETRESKKIEELALVIDTSYSTSGELVRAFWLRRTPCWKGRENFFHRMNLHLIQADNAVRQDIPSKTKTTSSVPVNHFELRGGGGTDFPARLRVRQQLYAEKKFPNLRGLLYFTDGRGTYQPGRPAYDTAFLFLGDRF